MLLNPDDLVVSVRALIEQLVLAHDRHNALSLPMMLREMGLADEFIDNCTTKYPDLNKQLRITDPDIAEQIITALAKEENVTITLEQIQLGLAGFGIRRVPPPYIPARNQHSINKMNRK